MRSNLALRLLLALTCVGLLGCGESSPEKTDATTRAATFVGSDRCGTCHETEFHSWQNSHHALAMQEATLETVLAPLPSNTSDAEFNHDDEGIWVSLQEGDEAARWQITHTFGVHPLQQYLVDTGRGRLQTLRQSWDSRAKGQRWFLQYPEEEIPTGDVLHWSGIAQNWNSMCADCHSTGVEKNYQPSTTSFDTSFAELSVGCESCHGPGSDHAANPTVGLPATTALADSALQTEVCAQCHSRRSQIAEGYTAGAALFDHYVPELLNQPLYHADGQINDEVYVYGSFVSSKMFAQGVTCNDCHEPHSASLRISDDGLCTQCHSPAGNPRFPSLIKAEYTEPTHSGHANDLEITCVSCHMPEKTYMGVDARADHSLRIPRPDLAEAHGVPSPCGQCHHETTSETLAFSTPESDHFSAKLLAADPLAADLLAPGQGQREVLLREVINQTAYPPIVRATALSRLSTANQSGTVRAIEAASRSSSTWLRWASIGHLGALQPARHISALQRLLVDPLRGIRIHAAMTALTTLDADTRQRLATELSSATDELIAANELNQETPSANVNLAQIYWRLGDLASAENYLATALAINDKFIPALLYRAELLREAGRDADAQPYLAKAVDLGDLDVTVPEADYAYAMWLVRNGSPELALIHLQRAYDNAPNEPRWAFAYAVALHSLGQSPSAIELLRSLQGKPIYAEQLMFLHATILRDLLPSQPQLTEEARAIANQLLAVAPSNRNYQTLAASLEASPAPPPKQ